MHVDTWSRTHSGQVLDEFRGTFKQQFTVFYIFFLLKILRTAYRTCVVPQPFTTRYKTDMTRPRFSTVIQRLTLKYVLLQPPHLKTCSPRNSVILFISQKVTFLGSSCLLLKFHSPYVPLLRTMSTRA